MSIANHYKVFSNALERVLDVLSYGYYCKADNLVSDQTYDELEYLYKKLNEGRLPKNRSVELEDKYTTSSKVLFDFLKGD